MPILQQQGILSMPISPKEVNFQVDIHEVIKSKLFSPKLLVLIGLQINWKKRQSSNN